MLTTRQTPPAYMAQDSKRKGKSLPISNPLRISPELLDSIAHIIRWAKQLGLPLDSEHADKLGVQTNDNRLSGHIHSREGEFNGQQAELSSYQKSTSRVVPTPTHLEILRKYLGLILLDLFASKSNKLVDNFIGLTEFSLQMQPDSLTHN